jgi:hypothetical protein
MLNLILVWVVRGFFLVCILARALTFPEIGYDSSYPISRQISVLAGYVPTSPAHLTELINLYESSDSEIVKSLALKAVKRAPIEESTTIKRIVARFYFPDLPEDQITSMFSGNSNRIFRLSTNQHPNTFIHGVAIKAEQEWKKTILPTFISRRELQIAWPGTSLWGGVWTVPRTESWFKNKSADFKKMTHVIFNMDSSPAFYDPQDSAHKTVWKNWGRAHSHEVNEFSQNQISKLSKNELPSHSKFYRDLGIVGIIDYNDWELFSSASIRPINAYIITDFSLVHSIEIQFHGSKSSSTFVYSDNSSRPKCTILLNSKGASP